MEKLEKSKRRTAARVCFLVILAGLILSSCDKNISVPVPEKAECWCYPRGNAQNTGFVPDTIPAEIHILWQTETAALDPSSATGAAGLAFVGLPNKRLVAYDLDTGEKRGDIWVDVPLMNPPVIVGNHLVWVGFGSWNRVGVYDFSTGKRVWSRHCGNTTLNPVVIDSVVVLFTASGGVYGLRLEDGKKLWAIRVKPGIESQPATDGEKIFFSAGEKIFSADITGKILWRRRINSTINLPLIYADGRIWAITDFGKIFSISPDSGKIISETATGISQTLPGATDGETLVLTSRTGEIAGYSIKNGDKLWEKKLGDVVVSAPIIVGKTIVVGTYSGNVVLVRTDGTVVRTIKVDGHIRKNPAFVDGKILISVQEGKLFCVGE